MSVSSFVHDPIDSFRCCFHSFHERPKKSQKIGGWKWSKYLAKLVFFEFLRTKLVFFGRTRPETVSKKVFVFELQKFSAHSKKKRRTQQTCAHEQFHWFIVLRMGFRINEKKKFSMQKKKIQHNQPRGKKSNLRAESEAFSSYWFPGDFTNNFFEVWLNFAQLLACAQHANSAKFFFSFEKIQDFFQKRGQKLQK